MKRTYRSYNNNLSAKVNAQLDKRSRTVHMQRRLIAIIAIIAVSVIILLGTSVNAFAVSGKNQQPVHKYYTSIQISSGDTVWDIADRYIAGYDVDKQAYIDEICELNHLQDGQIHSGDHLVVAYYSTEALE